MAISKKSKNLVNNYVSQKVLDSDNKLNKSQKMRNAGYSEKSVSKSISTIENGLYFREIANQILNKTGTVASSLLNSVENDVTCGNMDQYSMKEKINMLKTIVQISSSFSPSFRQKEKVKSVEGEDVTV